MEETDWRGFGQYLAEDRLGEAGDSGGRSLAQVQMQEEAAVAV